MNTSVFYFVDIKNFLHATYSSQLFFCTQCGMTLKNNAIIVHKSLQLLTNSNIFTNLTVMIFSTKIQQQLL